MSSTPKSLPILSPSSAKNRYSVAEGGAYWQVACLSKELGKRPLAAKVLGIPLVLFRDPFQEPGALLDRCPHRNVPLSLGRVTDGVLECAYHGWRFRRDGHCERVPGLENEFIKEACHGKGYPVRESGGLVWVFLHEGDPGEVEPMPLPYTSRKDYGTLYRRVDMPGSLHATIENALDVPHTAFLHSMLFRGQGEPRDIEVIVRRSGECIEAEYVGEPSPTGLMGRLLAPGGGLVYHVDRFLLPGVAQVEYRLSERSHLLITTFCTPLEDFVTRMHAVVSFKLPLPTWLVRPIIEPIALFVLKQDAKILAAQTRRVREFGGEQYCSTELDVLGAGIWRLLREAEEGRVSPVSELVEERRFTMRV